MRLTDMRHFLGLALLVIWANSVPVWTEENRFKCYTG
jgi:hypothetical protein